MIDRKADRYARGDIAGSGDFLEERADRHCEIEKDMIDNV